MIRVRALRPIDLIPFLRFCKRSPVNQGLVDSGNAALQLKPGDFVGVSAQPVRHCWIALSGGRIVGAIAVRPKARVDTWEIDRLVLAVDGDADEVCAELLRHLGEEAREEGVQRIFARCLADSPLARALPPAGFTRYTHETIYRLEHAAGSTAPSGFDLTPRRGLDHHALFRLYSAAVPGHVRQVEGMTLDEWRWSEGWRPHSPRRHFPFGDRRRDYVIRDDGTISAWLQVDRGRRSLALLWNPEVQLPLERIVEFGLAKLPPGGEAFCPVREYQGGLGPAIESLGFTPLADHELLVRTLAVWVKEPRLVPVSAGLGRVMSNG